MIADTAVAYDIASGLLAVQTCIPSEKETRLKIDQGEETRAKEADARPYSLIRHSRSGASASTSFWFTQGLGDKRMQASGGTAGRGGSAASELVEWRSSPAVADVASVLPPEDTRSTGCGRSGMPGRVRSREASSWWRARGDVKKSSLNLSSRVATVRRGRRAGAYRSTEP